MNSFQLKSFLWLASHSRRGTFYTAMQFFLAINFWKRAVVGSACFMAPSDDFSKKK